MDPDVLVNLAWSSNETEAHLAANHLESEGIRAHVFGGRARSGFYTPGLITLSLQVRAADYERARDALHEFLDETPANGRAVNLDGHCLVCEYDLSPLLPDVLTCPECGTDLVVEFDKQKRLRLAPPPAESSPTGARVGSLIGWAVLAFMVFMALALLAVILEPVLSHLGG